MSLVATLLERIQPMYEGVFDKNELRRTQAGALEVFANDTNDMNGILTPRVKEAIMNSFGRKGGVIIPVIDGKTVTIGNTRSCVVALDENNSQEVLLTFSTYAWGFTMHKAQYAQNEVGYIDDWNRKMNNYLVQLFKDMDSQCVDQLELDKNQAYSVDITNIYPELADALRVPLDEHEDAYNNIETIANVNDFEADFNVVASQTHKPLIKFLNNQGEANDINRSFQFGPYSYNYTNRISSGAGVKSTSYVIPKGTVAIMNRNDWDSKMKNKSTDGKQWDEVVLPMGPDMNGESGMKVGSIYHSSCVDAVAELGTALGGISEASLKEMFMFSTDVVTVTAYNRDRSTLAGPIQKYEFLAS